MNARRVNERSVAAGPRAGRWAAPAPFFAVVALALAACGGPADRPGRTAGPAVWVEPGTAALDFATLDTLRDAGVADLFLPAGKVVWSGDRARGEASLPTAPRRQPVTLVVAGGWPPAELSERDPAAAAESLAAALRGLGLAAEGAGWLPVGYHLPPPEGDLVALAKVAAALRDRLETSLLSIELDRRRLDLPDLERLAGAVDFVVCFLYGQRPDEREDAAAWRRDDALAAGRELAALDVPFLAGVVTVGSVAVVDERGGPLAVTTEGSLGRLARHPALELSKKWLPEAMDRRLTRFEVVRRLRLADGVEARPGQQLRAVFLAPRDLLELTGALAGERSAGELDGYLGPLFYRLAAAGEGFSLSLPALAAVARGAVPPPGLELSVESSGGGLRVSVANLGSSATGVALLEHNFVEVAIDRGRVTAVDNGGFRRSVLGRRGEDARTMADYRQADRVRLFVPALDPGETVTSGRIVLAGGGEVVVSGLFLAADGSVVELAPRAIP